MEYRAQCPEIPPSSPPGNFVQVCETAFAHGNHVLAWNKRFNPENLAKYPYGTQTNRWGWFSLLNSSEGAIQVSQKIYSGAGRNNIEKATEIGSAVFAYNPDVEGGVPSVTISIILN